MTKEELEKKRDEICLKLANEFYPDSRMWDSRDGNFFNGAKAGFDSAVSLLLPRLGALEMAAKCLEVLEKEIDSGRGISIYKNEGSHRAIKQALDNLKEKKNE